MRTKYWWEKFDWFISSENLLVLCAKDSLQGETLVRRHLRANDAYVHADVANAPVCIVKHAPFLGMGPIPPLTLSQVRATIPHHLPPSPTLSHHLPCVATTPA